MGPAGAVASRHSPPRNNACRRNGRPPAARTTIRRARLVACRTMVAGASACRSEGPCGVEARVRGRGGSATVDRSLPKTVRMRPFLSIAESEICWTIPRTDHGEAVLASGSALSGQAGIELVGSSATKRVGVGRPAAAPFARISRVFRNSERPPSPPFRPCIVRRRVGRRHRNLEC